MSNSVRNILIAGVVLVVLAAATLFFMNENVTNEGNRKEADLSAQYRDNRNELSSCLQRIETAAGTTTQQTEVMTEALVEAVKGRYEGLQSNQGAMFSAMVEDYPELKPYDDAFARAYNTIDGCQQDYKNIQSKLLDKISAYDSWRTGNTVVRYLGDGEYPSSNLQADEFTGELALAKMKDIVVVQEADKAYETGELDVPDPWTAK